jgi:hypothetical protein
MPISLTPRASKGRAVYGRRNTTSIAGNLLRRLIELPETGRTTTGGILRGYAELKATGYAKTSIVDGDIFYRDNRTGA